VDAPICQRLLLLTRPDQSSITIGVRTSTSENAMKVGNDADFYIYIQNVKSATPTVYILTKGEVTALGGGPTVAPASSVHLNKWAKILREFKN
jgi:hypothetical protein